MDSFVVKIFTPEKGIVFDAGKGLSAILAALRENGDKNTGNHPRFHLYGVRRWFLLRSPGFPAPNLSP